MCEVLLGFYACKSTHYFGKQTKKLPQSPETFAVADVQRCIYD